MNKRYSCSGCLFQSGRRNVLTRHILRKIKCSENPKLIDNPIIKCKYCNSYIKTITNIDHIENHLKVCESYNNNITTNTTNTTNNNITNNNITNNNITNTTNIQIIMNTIMNPSISHINVEDYEKVLKASQPELFKLLYFNINVPSNHVIAYGPEESKNGVIKVINDSKKFDYIALDKFNTKTEAVLECIQNDLVRTFDNPKREELDIMLNDNFNNKSRNERELDKLNMLNIAKVNNEMVKKTMKKSGIF